MPLDATASDVTLPAGDWRPRDYQLPLWRYLEHGGTRACAIYHRRAGKDEVALHWTCIAAHQRVGGYWHMLPQANQARRAIWAAVNPHTGKRRIDEAFPLALRAQTLENEMFIRFKNGSTWQVVGSDNYDALVGSAPAGVVFSEWALSHPSSWGYISPILRENGGWALFITTPRGKNHAKATFDDFSGRGGYFAEALRADQTDVFDAEALAEERRSLIGQYGEDMGAALFDQEYMVSWDAAILGSYWGAEIAKAEREGRVGAVPVDPQLPVHTAWDIGRRDATAIWFFQTDGQRIRVVDYYANTGHNAAHYAQVVHDRGYRRGTAWLPHDAKVTEWTANRTRIQTLMDMGLKAELVPDHKLMDGINSARMTLPLCEFDATKCASGIEALKAYQKTWDERLQRFSDLPLHNWASDGADAFRYLCISWRADILTPPKPNPRGVSVGDANQVTLRDLDRMSNLNWRR
jgi:phage terminase large subunit